MVQPHSGFDLNGQNIIGGGSITAAELHGATYWGDVHLEDMECAVCHKKFKVGDKLILVVNLVKEKSITAVPMHLACGGGE